MMPTHHRRSRTRIRASWFGYLAPVLVMGSLAGWFYISSAKTFDIRNGSMEDTISVGSLILVVPQDEYQVGDIVTFPANGSVTTTHRIIEVRPDGELITKGDANRTPDAWNTPLYQSDVIGKVTGPPIPRIGHYLNPMFWEWQTTQPRFYAAMALLLLAAALVVTLLAVPPDDESARANPAP